jgi:hypothetical protein
MISFNGLIEGLGCMFALLVGFVLGVLSLIGLLAMPLVGIIVTMVTIYIIGWALERFL